MESTDGGQLHSTNSNPTKRFVITTHFGLNQLLESHDSILPRATFQSNNKCLQLNLRTMLDDRRQGHRRWLELPNAGVC